MMASLKRGQGYGPYVQRNSFRPDGLESVVLVVQASRLRCSRAGGTPALLFAGRRDACTTKVQFVAVGGGGQGALPPDGAPLGGQGAEPGAASTVPEVRSTMRTWLTGSG